MNLICTDDLGIAAQIKDMEANISSPLKNLTNVP